MRDQRDVQLAHDVLHAIVVDQAMLELSPAQNLIHHAVHDVLSWVLGGPCGAVFDENLAHLQEQLIARGYVMVKRS